MSRTGNRNRRTLKLSVLCLIGWQFVEISPVFAQRRVSPSSRPETPSQRWLPLPSGDSPDLKQQMQWLLQLKELLRAEPLGGESPALPKFDPEQLKTLLELMKQMSGGASDGTQPPALNGITAEQVSRAMADPAMREQVRRMLDQFSKDGKLPQGEAKADSTEAPFPTTSNNEGKRIGDELSDQGRTANKPREDLPTMPRAMRELLQRLSQQASRQPNGLPLEHDPTADGALEREPGDDNRNSPRPDGLNGQPGNPKTNARIPTNDAAPLNPERSDVANSRAKPIPRTDRQVREQEPGTINSQSDSNRQTPTSGAVLQPTGRPSRGTTPLPEGTPPVGSTQHVETTQSETTERMPGADARSVTSRNRELKREPSARVSGGEMLRNIPPSRDQANSGQADSRNSRSTSPPQNPQSSMGDASNGTAGTKRPSMDVRTELEEQGFAQTLRKMVEQAREEILVASNAAEGSAARGDSSGRGLGGTAARMIDGLSKNLAETAAERPAPPTTAAAMRPEAARPSTAQLDATRDTASNSISNAAKDILSNIATAPAATPAPIRSSQSNSSGAVADSQGVGSRSTLGLLMLLVVLGLVWYFIPQLLAGISRSQRVVSPLVAELHPADIHTRRDVVRAFHQYALRPVTAVPTWWTHREVERQVAETTPKLQPTIQTLASLYEQARYLPDDTEFTPDQIAAVRHALEECEHVSESNHRG